MSDDPHDDARGAEAAHARLILDTANDAFISIDPAGVIVDWNQAAERTLGWTREEALGLLLVRTVIPERYREAHDRGLRHLLETGEGPVLFETLELSALHRAGHELPIELTIWPSRMSGEWRFNAFLRDVSDRVRMQSHVQLLQRVTAAANAAEDLREAMQIALREVAELTGWPVGHVYVRGWNQQRLEPTGWWTVGAGPYEHFREVTARMGFAEEEGLPGRVASQNRPSLIRDVSEDDNYPRAEAAIRDGLVGAFAFPVVSEQRVVAVMEFYSTRAELPGDDLLDLMANVGLQLGRVFERLRWRSELQAALETKTKLLSMVAHEFRTPAFVIGGFADLLIDGFDEIEDADKKSHLEAIREHVVRLQRLVTNALHAARIDAGELRPRPAVVALASFAEEVLRRLQLAGEVDLHGERDLTALVDPDHLEHVLTNYLTNARLYGRSPITIEIGPGTAPDHQDDRPDTVVVRVCDRGPGVAPAFVPELFRSFRRGTTRGGGSGLGLSIVRELAHANRGDAWYEPLDPGAAFAIRLPAGPTAV